MISKRLTAEEVAAKRFTPVRLREGYSMDEVDAFLDEVEGTLSDQEKEIKELQLQVKQGAGAAAALLDKPGGAPADMAPVLAELSAANERVARLEKELAEAKAAAASSPAAPASNPLGEAAASATRMLEMAARQHDELVAQGQATSEKIIADAREKAEQEAAAAAKLREEKLGDLEAERAALESGIEALRQLESRSREALHAHFNEKLEELKNSVIDVEGAKREAKAARSTPPPAPPAEASSDDRPAGLPTQAPDTNEPKAPEGPTPPTAYQEFPSFFGSNQGA